MLSLERLALAGTAGALLLGGAYWKGRADCGAHQRKLQAAVAAEWAERVTAASTDAFAAALKTARQEGTDRKDLKGVVKEAPNTGHVCVSADAVERLRQLQAD